MIKYLCGTLLLLTIVTACKKKDQPYTGMTVFVNGDSSFTTNSVNNYPTGNNLITLSSRDPVSLKSVKLGIFDYREGLKTYNIYYNGIAVNVDGNTAEYADESKTAAATNGSISITKVNVKTIEGTFDFNTPGEHVSGTFIALKP